MENIDLNQAMQRLPELIEVAVGGDEVITTKGGKAFVKLVAIGQSKRQRQFGSARGLIKISNDFDEPLEDFRGYM